MKTGDWRMQDEHRKILISVHYNNPHTDNDQLSWTVSIVSAILGGKCLYAKWPSPMKLLLFVWTFSMTH
jgi:hypothetical protein